MLIGILSLGLMAAVASTQNIIYDINTQANCTLVQRGPTEDCRWVAGLDMADQIIENGRIIAYKIFWFGGGLSRWYVPGLNDLSTVYNPTGIVNCGLSYRNNTMRRRWAMFNDHTHKFIICKPSNIEL